MLNSTARPNWLRPAVLAPLAQHSEALKSSVEAEQDEDGFFLYDLDYLEQHLSVLMQQEVIKLWFAVKANPLSRVISTLAQQGFNFDVASQGELTQVLAQNVQADRILNTGPAKSKRQMKAFLSQGVRTFVVESLNQLQWLNEAAIELACQPQVLLRVQLQWQEGEKNPLGGNEVTPFGLSCQEWQTIKVSHFPALNINGLHIFQWGNMLSNARMFELWSQMVTPLLSLAEQLGMRLEVLDLGGGLGVDYLQTGQGLSWKKIVADLAKIKAQAGVSELWLELGRFAVADMGYYVTSVVDRKQNFQQQQLVLAGGINHLIRPAITEQPFPVAMLRESAASPCYFDLHGPLCTSLDKLGTLAIASDVEVGDQLIFGLAGAYGFTESMPFFLCHQIAAEYVLQQGKIEQVRAAEPATWYLR
ncbi:PLP-dependent decarboxylase [Colwellia sp. MB02u-18]|nr:PLP-dependent decarboxylase [Colwellia sp. MB3u-45]MBA6268394.1 PLP-dependent decarboxylase [Colwellia sp. MB3u-43]MBA6319845.1 PLP-dependent decarboxylase [Colwellia sp. MB02u-19]MBA6324611.1 PLP-dependent decarboxylase [Colwellia sp. MB02u-18]MBA6330766.1 PLP-dependent decarboxylase [Colwellia sp. MB02u-12]MBA6346282.1 PLP-dependent decarboxylase [Colwellia sp. MB02u-1]